MTYRQAPALPFVLLLVTAVSACDDPMFATEPGSSIITSAVDQLVVESKGGGLPPAPGAVCEPQLWSYNLGFGTRSLLWSRWTVSGAGTESADCPSETGSRTLPLSDYDTAVAAARAIRVSSRASCGVDKPTLFVEVWSGLTNYIYGDDFYSCRPDNKHFVESEGVDKFASLLTSLAHD